MDEILRIFLKITKIPRCSYNTRKMGIFLINYAKQFDYMVQKDNTGNILISSAKPKICLQAHYDMVCVGDAPNIESVIKGSVLKAKNSSLGADNGMAIAMMLKLMQEGAEAEFLFTNDEEVGLIGAKNLELKIKSPNLLNLDSEDEQEVYIGCAGGADLKLTKELQNVTEEGNFYEISLTNLPGGHSGVDIDKNIPNAILELAKFIRDNGCKISYFSGGERINSIPANAKAAVLSKKALKSAGNISVTPAAPAKVSSFDINELFALPNGVLEINREFNAVQSSSNLAIVNITPQKAVIEISYRSLNNDDLDNITQKAKSVYENLGYSVELNDKYPGWTPEINDFTKKVQNAVTSIYGSCKTKVIHAGLECGILSQKLPNVKMASIGPTIRYPHSVREYVELDSVERTYEVVKILVNSDSDN